MEGALTEGVNAGGRPTLYTDELAETICTWVAETSMGLRKICRELGLCYSTVSKWTLPSSASYRQEFRQQYLDAKEQQAEVLAEELLEIADNMAHDTIVQPNGKTTGNAVHIARCKLRIAVRQWLMGRLAPKRWGAPAKAAKDGPAMEEMEETKQLYKLGNYELDFDDDTETFSGKIDAWMAEVGWGLLGKTPDGMPLPDTPDNVCPDTTRAPEWGSAG